MLVVRLTEKEFEDLNELYIQIKTIQNLHDGKEDCAENYYNTEYRYNK
jgi:hypothetical protein